jgi:lipid-binding SYLF domain-containing protein
VSAQTDAARRAEMLTYSRSRGIFAGISLEGATLRPDDDAIKELYSGGVTNREILTGGVKTPAAAVKLDTLLNRNSARKG